MSELELKIQSDPGRVVLTLIRKGRIIASNDGETSRQAAERLVRAVNRIAEKAEQLVIDLGILTDADIERALEHTDRSPAAVALVEIAESLLTGASRVAPPASSSPPLESPRVELAPACPSCTRSVADAPGDSCATPKEHG